jgi:hypothetical protein
MGKHARPREEARETSIAESPWYVVPALLSET